ncbi:unnamed protein product [Prunus armeniaca]|uniref:Uncharacterized protein n=1 Tax=Prunus armeniaca TaxID=36596 RepID=A0A6J5XWT4_PRUAR|nr:unnamed protein product [Prunus armeniaca]
MLKEMRCGFGDVNGGVRSDPCGAAAGAASAAAAAIRSAFGSRHHSPPPLLLALSPSVVQLPDIDHLPPIV